MVIWFKSEKALKYLLDHGFVYTLRRRRSTGLHHVRDGSGRVVGLAKIEEIGIFFLEPDPDWPVLKDIYGYTVKGLRVYLMDFVEHSGFDSLTEWLHEFQRLHKRRKRTAWLYKVELMEDWR